MDSQGAMHPATTSKNAIISTEILDLIIIGGGLSGLVVANKYHHKSSLTSSSSSWKLLDARSILGGRLMNDSKGHRIDLGGAWIWPNHQPHMRKLVSKLKISTFLQPDDISSIRVDGGAIQFIHALSNDLPSENIILNSPVTKCTYVENNTSRNLGNMGPYIEVTTGNDDLLDNLDSPTPSSSIFRSKRVVIAVPPKLIAKHIIFDPPFSNEKQVAMEETHTWMAGVTKIAIVYKENFWKHRQHDVKTNMGLPTHIGPAFQVYDASTNDGTIAALTFFALVDSKSISASDDQVLAKEVTNQLAQVWKYMDYDDDIIQQLSYRSNWKDIHVQHWPMEKYISEDSNPKQIHPHPQPIPFLSQSVWNNQLLFAGSESDLYSPGVMEGAIGAAKRVLQEILCKVK